MKGLIRKILKEVEDDFDWVETEIPQVVVTDRGEWYPTHILAMIDLDVTGAADFFEKYGGTDWPQKPGQPDSEFLLEKLPHTIRPKNGDLCYLIDSNPYKGGYAIIYKLVRVSDGGEFIISERGFQPYTETLSI